MVLKGGQIYMAQLIRALQVMVHLPLNWVPFPASSILFVSQVIEVAMYDVLGVFDLNIDRAFQYDEKKAHHYEDQ